MKHTFCLLEEESIRSSRHHSLNLTNESPNLLRVGYYQKKMVYQIQVNRIIKHKNPLTKIKEGGGGLAFILYSYLTDEPPHLIWKSALSV